MGIFSNFIKNRNSIADVLQSLDNFKVDQPSFEAVKKYSSAFFGDNWKFNLEMYISSLPKNDRAKYYEIFKMVVEYETALNYWNRALKITNYTAGVSRDDLIEAGLYKKYLSKFGVEGTRLYQKLEKFLSVNEKNDDVVEPKVQKSVSNISSDYNEKLQDTIKKQVEKVENSLNTIKKEILKSSDKKDNNFTATLTEVISEPVVKKQEKKTNKKDEAIKQKNKDWDIQNFYQIHEFMPILRNVMAVISLYKQASAIEDYNGYVFLNDVLDYLVYEGEKILSKITDEDIKKDLLKIIEQYKQEKLNEIEYTPKTEIDNIGEKPYKHPYENA